MAIHDWKFKKKPENFNSGYDQNGTGQAQGMKANQVRVDQGIIQDDFAPICRKEEGQGVRSQEVSALAAQPTFTQRQYQKILHMLDKEEVGTSGTNIAENMAGITGIIDTIISVNSTVKEGWIIDSGANCHMTHNLHRLHSVCNFLDHLNRSVHLPNGETVSVTHSESYKTLGGDLLKNVLVVPTFKFYLLSVSQLTKQLHCLVNLVPECVVF